jgi:hypothetical protein
MSNARFLRSNYFRKIAHALLPLLLGVYSTCPGHAQTASQSQRSNLGASKPLEGQVQLDEQLPPASPSLGFGNKVNSQELESLTPGNVWHIIPKWIAGKWHSDEEIISHIHNFRTGGDVQFSKHQKAVRDQNYGEQRDKIGQIWSFDGVPTTSKAEIAFGMSYFVTSQFDRLRPYESTFVSKSRFDEIQVNKKGIIIRTLQCEQLSTYEQIDDGLMKKHAVQKVFDNFGNPILVQEGDLLWKRIAPYEAIDKKEGRDLKKLFVEFLRRTGQEALVP